MRILPLYQALLAALILDSCTAESSPEKRCITLENCTGQAISDMPLTAMRTRYNGLSPWREYGPTVWTDAEGSACTCGPEWTAFEWRKEKPSTSPQVILLGLPSPSDIESHRHHFADQHTQGEFQWSGLWKQATLSGWMRWDHLGQSGWEPAHLPALIPLRSMLPCGPLGPLRIRCYRANQGLPHLDTLLQFKSPQAPLVFE